METELWGREPWEESCGEHRAVGNIEPCEQSCGEPRATGTDLWGAQSHRNIELSEQRTTLRTLMLIELWEPRE